MLFSNYTNYKVIFSGHRVLFWAENFYEAAEFMEKVLCIKLPPKCVEPVFKDSELELQLSWSWCKNSRHFFAAINLSRYTHSTHSMREGLLVPCSLPSIVCARCRGCLSRVQGLSGLWSFYQKMAINSSDNKHPTLERWFVSFFDIFSGITRGTEKKFWCQKQMWYTLATLSRSVRIAQLVKAPPTRLQPGAARFESRRENFFHSATHFRWATFSSGTAKKKPGVPMDCWGVIFSRMLLYTHLGFPLPAMPNLAQYWNLWANYAKACDTPRALEKSSSSFEGGLFCVRFESVFICRREAKNKEFSVVGEFFLLFFLHTP